MLTQEVVKSLFTYSPDTGELRNKVKRAQRSKIGDSPGYINHDGYLRIQIKGKNYMAHRIIWLYVYGEWPINQLDHINGIPSDNRISNLRPATNSENRQNLHRAHKNNKSGFLGVGKNWNKWKACIKINNKLIYLGSYKTPQEAHKVYMEAKRRIHHACTI